MLDPNRSASGMGRRADQDASAIRLAPNDSRLLWYPYGQGHTSIRSAPSCFKMSGFPSPNLVDVDDTLTEFSAEPSLWESLPEQDLTFDDYVLVDTDVAVWEVLSDAVIGALNPSNTESDGDESED
ncbi:hypothetical protein TNCV_745981 [Trichonephila clavipes]|nr:hypothetical protein TNCV_745981 [Trichonephila clavipes]